MGLRGRGLLTVGIAMPLLGLWTLFPDLPQAAPAERGEPTSERPPALVGTASCSGRGCHGDLEPSGPTAESASRFSFTTWCRRDKHADSYQVLLSEQSTRIARQLGWENPAKDVRCLACHTNPQAAAATTDEAVAELPFGVGCEACHGPAEHWLGPHKSARWQSLPEAARRRVYALKGMTWLRDLETRARVCAGCHIGSPVDRETGLPLRDVNHDLIAAGHPRLLFEFGTYQANMPEHWAKKQRPPSFEAQTWVVGQVVSVEAALTLLADRATDRNRPWPEFAEYDCYACHHGLTEPSWRQKRDGGRPGLGLPHTGSWPYALLPLTRDLTADEMDTTPLQNLQDAMMRLHPNRDEIADGAKRAIKALNGRAKQCGAMEFDESRLSALRTKLAEHGQNAGFAEWEEMEQVFLALAAVNEAYHNTLAQSHRQPTDKDRRIDDAVRRLGRKLAFPPGSNSPTEFRQTPAWEADLKSLLEQCRKAKAGE
jgi:hypothetical protein